MPAVAGRLLLALTPDGRRRSAPSLAYPRGMLDGRERAGLLLFGVLEIFAGIFLAISAAVLTALAFGAGGALGLDGLSEPSPIRAPGFGTAALLYAGLAALFVMLGIGSIQPRRWVRPLVLYVSTLWLMAGVLLLVVMAGLVLSASRAGALLEPGAESPDGILGSPIVLLFLGAVSLVLYLLLPAALFWFHRRPALKSALERLDPVLRWTDRCPAPVLSLSLSPPVRPITAAATSSSRASFRI